MSDARDMSVVLLPGMHGTGDFMTDLVATLAQHRRVRVFAYPQDRPLGYAEITAFFAQQMPSEPFLLAGESFAGPIAIEIAASNPNVRGLILASTFARNPWPSQFSALASRIDIGLIPRRVLEVILFGFDAPPELGSRLADILARVPPEVLRRRVLEVLRIDQRAALRRVTCPVLVLHGRSDWLVRSRFAREIQAIVPIAQLHWFDAAHELLATHAGDAAAVIERFCAGVDQDSTLLGSVRL
jgi:pimeloyl-[acyl-carrier protein] methyl ester esterase